MTGMRVSATGPIAPSRLASIRRGYRPSRRSRGYRKRLHASCRSGSQRRAAAQLAGPRLRRVRVPLPGRHRRRGAGDPRPPLRLGGQGVVGAARGRRRAVRQGRAGAPSDAQRRARRDGMALARGHGLDRPREHGQARGRRALQPRDDRRRARRAARGAGRASAAGGCGCRSPARSRRRCWRPAARGWTRARCAAPRACRSTSTPRRPRSRSSRATASCASSSTSTGTPRRCPPSSRCPPARRTAARCPVDPYLLEPLEHYLRLFGVEPAANAREVLDRLRREHDAAIDDVRRSRAFDADALAIEDRLGGELRAVPARGRRLRAARPAHVPGRRAGPRQDRAGARRAGGRRRLPGRDRLPGGPEAQLAARDRALAAAPLGAGDQRHRRGADGGRDHRSSTTRSCTRTACGCSCAARRRSCSTSPTTSRTRAPSARRPCGGSRRRCPRARCGWR